MEKGKANKYYKVNNRKFWKGKSTMIEEAWVKMLFNKKMN
jgi:hypothetical protein